MPQDTSRKILDAAAAILAGEGSAAVSLRAVARAAKVTPMAIYHHFEDRESLLAALVEREIQNFVALIKKAPPYPSHATALLHNADAYLEFALRFPKVFLFLFTEPRAAIRQYPADFESGRSPSLNLLADLVRAAMEDGYLRKDDVWAVTFQLWANNHGYAMLYLGGRIKLSKKRFFELVHQSTSRLLHGLKN